MARYLPQKSLMRSTLYLNEYNFILPKKTLTLLRVTYYDQFYFDNFNKLYYIVSSI